jgi:hypothetical protein
MLTCGSESLSADPIELLVRMDCRIKSGNDERKRRRNADGRISNDPHQRMRRALKASALACRRSTAALAAANERRSSAPATRFLGPGRSARSRWFERSCAAQRMIRKSGNRFSDKIMRR